MTTDISSLQNFSNSNSEEEIDINNLPKNIVDLSLSLSTRIKALNMLHSEDPEKTGDIINQLEMMYQISGTISLKKYLYAICEQSTINPILKSLSAKALYIANPKDDTGYKAINIIYPTMDSKLVGTPCKLELLKILMTNDNYKKNSLIYFSDIISDNSISSRFRLQTINGLGEKLIYFVVNGSYIFLQNTKNHISDRIISGQYLLKNSSHLSSEQILTTENILINLAESKDTEYNLRADASDILLQYGSEHAKNSAMKIIIELGQNPQNKNSKSLYENAQNVHSKSIEQSVIGALEFLQTFGIMEIDKKPITLEYTFSKILELCKPENLEKISVSLSRITIDTALYSKYNCTLGNILLRVWTYISGHKSSEQMKQRLLEELADMAGTCSSGFASRLVNTISGFGDFSMRISWKEQIISNFSGRLNALVRNMDDLNLQEKILEQMAIDTSQIQSRRHFLKFLRNNIPYIREEMYKEFKEHIDDTDFDLYFRSAISQYEAGVR